MSRSGAVLLLHGQPDSARDWDPLRATLAGSIDAVAPDRPGWDGRGGATDLARNAAPAIEALDNELHRITTPTVVVAGAADRIVPTAANEALAAQIPGAEFVLLRRAGYLLPHRHAERPAEIIEARVRSSS